MVVLAHDGRLLRWPVRACLAVAAGGLIALALLTTLPQYPRSLVLPRWTVLTFDAPTLSIVVAGVWLIGAALAVRRTAERRLTSPRVWRLVTHANRVTMPAYPWHMTAYLIAASLLTRLRFAWGTDPTASSWCGRPVMLVASGLVLTVIVAGTLPAAMRNDRRDRPGRKTVPRRPVGPDGRGSRPSNLGGARRGRRSLPPHHWG